LRSLSQSVSQGTPLHDALIPIIKFAGPLKLRRRLINANEAMEQGAESWQSIQAAGILKAKETHVLESSQRTGNLPWALETLATTIEWCRLFRIKAFLELLQPAMVIPIALLVFFIAVAFFMPLVKMLNDFS